MELLSQKGRMIEPNLFHIDSLVEKPSKEEAPSRLCHNGEICFKTGDF